MRRARQRAGHQHWIPRHGCTQRQKALYHSSFTLGWTMPTWNLRVTIAFWKAKATNVFSTPLTGRGGQSIAPKSGAYIHPSLSL